MHAVTIKIEALILKERRKGEVGKFGGGGKKVCNYIIISKLEKLKKILLNLCKSSRTGVPENLCHFEGVQKFFN